MGLNLNLEGVQENSPIPDGVYPVILNSAEVAPTKAGGSMIKVQLKIQEGAPHAGRVLFDQFNIENANPKAAQIGLGQLKTMMKAFGHKNPNMLKSSEELIGLKGIVAVKVVDDGGSYGPQTRVRAYKPLAASEGGGFAPTTAPATGTAAKTNPFG
jgi:hypothetical protein